MASYRRADDLYSPAGWLHVQRDQLRAQRSVTSMGSLYLYLYCYNYHREVSAKLAFFAVSGRRIFWFLVTKNYSPNHHHGMELDNSGKRRRFFSQYSGVHELNYENVCGEIVLQFHNLVTDFYLKRSYFVAFVHFVNCCNWFLYWQMLSRYVSDYFVYDYTMWCS